MIGTTFTCIKFPHRKHGRIFADKYPLFTYTTLLANNPYW